MATRRKPDALYQLCRRLPGVTEDVKWGNNLVFSVGGKMFVAFDLPEGEPVGLKVHPAAFAMLTKKPGIVPAPYLARHSWVQLHSRNVLPSDALAQLIREAHALVAAKLPKKIRDSLGL